MALNDIRLPSSVVADLYRSSLIDTETEPSASKAEKIFVEKEATFDNKRSRFKYLGENLKNILIIVGHTDSVYLPDDDFNFLTSMLTACKLSAADVAIFNLNNHPEISYKELITHFKSKNVFLFGIKPEAFGLPISFPHFQLQAFANCSFLFSPSLKELEVDKMLKSKLWVCLRRIFNI